MQNVKPLDSPYKQLDESPTRPDYGVNPSYPSQMNQGGYPMNNEQMNYNQNEQFAQDLNQLRAQKSSCHVQAMIANLLLVGGVTTALVLYFLTDVDLPFGALIGICVGSYLLYLIIACCGNRTGSYLGNVDKGQNFQHYYEWIRRGIGHFWFHAECYHYETRHHTRTVNDGNGGTRTQYYTTTQKVVTHVGNESLTPTNTKDQSGSIDRIRANSSIVFIHFFVRHRFSDQQSQYNFNNFFQGFKMRHMRDAHQTYTYGYTLPGLVERKTFYVGELSCNLRCWYYVFGIFGCLWPYSLWLETKVNRFKVDTMKVVTL